MVNEEDYGEARLRLMSEVRAKYKGMLDQLSPDARERAVLKLMEQEARERLRAAAAKQKEPAVPAPSAEQARTTAPEQPLGVMDASQWLEWNAVPYSPEKFSQFTAAFVPELNRTLQTLSKDLQKQASQLEGIKNLYIRILFRMYTNAYPDRPEGELIDNVKDWLNDRWKEALAAARRLAPMP